jgi:hypothetical protein
MPSSTTLVSNSRKVQRACPLGGLEQAEISFAAMIPSAAKNGDKSESPNHFKLVEAGD